MGRHRVRLTPLRRASHLRRLGRQFRARSTSRKAYRMVHCTPTDGGLNDVESSHLHYRPIGAANIFRHHRYNPGVFPAESIAIAHRMSNSHCEHRKTLEAPETATELGGPRETMRNE